MSDDPNARQGLRLLRRYRAATLAFGDRRAHVQFVFSPATGRIVMPVGSDAAALDEFTLYLPTESDCDATALLIPARIERPEAEESVDRWSAYHGLPPGGCAWTSSRVLGIKSTADSGDAVMDEAALTVANPLGRSEFGVIRAANADRPRLTRAVHAITGASVSGALCVGVDELGIDIRAPFGIVRIEFPAAAADAAAAEAMLREHILARGDAA
ncbi:MAG: hypothetical protein KF699_16205 [Phycisphaeraceae bacterium]|nr:hypothetical protein [Phycisphaeraceae bacterium]